MHQILQYSNAVNSRDLESYLCKSLLKSSSPFKIKVDIGVQVSGGVCASLPFGCLSTWVDTGEPELSSLGHLEYFNQCNFNECMTDSGIILKPHDILFHIFMYFNMWLYMYVQEWPVLIIW